jgi:hypothetical protein
MRQNLRALERRSVGAASLTAFFTRTLPMIGLGRSAELQSYFAREEFPQAAPGVRRGLELLEANERLRARTLGRGPVAPAS